MSDFECFAFFCEDFRTEVGGKTSYMGVLGPRINLEPSDEDAPPDAKEVIAKLVVVAMIRTSKQGDIPLKVDLFFENAPDGIVQHIKSDHVLSVSGERDENLAQFHAQMPHVPAHPGMKIVVNFKIGGQCFSTSLLMDGPEAPTPRVRTH
ncbi:MAG: hypothetical protein EOP62_23275 [Sphingomonadales bacterium]|nr:MAG: hypothetical protein EOP62_23275 [Sphingomonadales bacterium]